ncbi:MAG TPA: pyrroloquinoline quinone biosynthesis protein PqqE [Nitrospiraceae bacterium]|nr:pyrroloquinoline quinone biosynthesis protein PqqE [Nitrospiraceae bacterium]
MSRERPYTLIAELTYRCPLRCPYCSNPTDCESRPAVETDTWRRAFREADELGIMQVHLTGGEPLLRDDVEELVRQAHDLELYTNLITSGIPLDERRLGRLVESGLNAVQLSIQAATAAASDEIAGVSCFRRKCEAARWIKEAGLPLTLNVVMHRNNLDDVPAIIALAEELKADRLELATAQYAGWAFLNREALLPTEEQLTRARAQVQAAKARLTGRMEIVFVLPDYYSEMPKTCMDGWGRRYVVITPDGLVLPCHAAHMLPGPEPPRITDEPLAAIWRSSELFQRFRGEEWMPAPCRTCDRRAVDFGGCRCQAFLLTGNPAATDPACSLSPHHDLILQARAEACSAERPPLRYRQLTMVP